MLVRLSAILVGSGVVAGGLLAYLPRPERNGAPPTEVAAQPFRSASKADAPSSTQTSDKKAPAESVEDKTNLLQQPRNAQHQGGNAASAEPAPETQAWPVSPDEPLEISAENQKNRVAEERNGVGDDAPRKPDPLNVLKDPRGVPRGPKLRVIADTPRGLYVERTKPKTAEWLGERGGTIESQNAVEDGLTWLARHQAEDGHWGADCLGTAPNNRSLTSLRRLLNLHEIWLATHKFGDEIFRSSESRESTKIC